jgi:hypothetical protein
MHPNNPLSFPMLFNQPDRLRVLVTVIAFILAIGCAATSSAQQTLDPEDSYAQRVPGTVYVQFREGYIPDLVRKASSPSMHVDPVTRIFNKIGVTSIELFDKMAWKDSISHSLGIDRIYVVNYATNEQPIAVVVKLLHTGLVQTASPRYIFKVQDVPNDPDYGDQWYLQNIKMEAAWGITHGDTNVVIADVDEGVNYNHEDLAANIKYNKGEFVKGKPDPNNKKDLDGNGFVNDYRGWDAAGQTTGGFPMPNNDPYPSMTPGGIAGESSHGTNTTGCFGAVGNNHIGMAGVAFNCKILPVKIGNANGQLIAGYEGVHYAAVAKAKVINCSWGGRADPAALPFAQIFPDEVTARGEVMVAAAGNYHMNNDITPFVPACIPGVLSVGASDENDKPTSFTHWGHIVSVFAPGIDIYTTDIGIDKTFNNVYTPIGATIAGTSFSSPITAGIVGLVMSKFPKMSPAAVKQRIIETCDPMQGAGTDGYLYHGRVNAFAALNAPGHPSIAVQGFSVSGGSGDSLDVIGQPSTINVTFQNGGLPGTNLNAELQPGPGYSWDQFDPNSHNYWPKSNIATLDSQASFVGQLKSVERSGQFSEGFATPAIYVHDGAGYQDTLHVQVPVTKKPGMTHKLNIQHATCIKQVDETTGWAGFGYYLNYHDPELKKDIFVLISQFSKRGPGGAWSDLADVAGGDVPVTTVAALDDNHAWFSGVSPSGSAEIMYTIDGGNSWNSTSTSTVNAIHFKDAQNGLYLGQAGGKAQIYFSQNGGQSWNAGSLSANVGEHSFNNAAWFHGQNGWFGTNQHRVFYTTDGGTGWHPTSLQGTAMQNNVMAVGFADDDNTGYAAIRGFGGNPDSAGLFYSQSKGTQWQKYDPISKISPANLIAYSIAFIPGTTTAIITTNQGVFTLKSPTDSMLYLGAPSSWDPRYSVVSAAGSSSAKYTVSAASENTGVADYAVGTSNAVRQSAGASQDFTLSNAPNPFTNATTLYFSTEKEGHVHIAMADVLGRIVFVIYDGSLPEGPHAIAVSATDLARGVYHCSLETESGKRADTKVVVMR